MKLFLGSLLIATTSTMAFQASSVSVAVAPSSMRSRQRWRHQAPNVATLLVDEIRFNEYPQSLFQKSKQDYVYSVSMSPNWKQILDEATVTFAEFRELAAAGLLQNDDQITLEEAKRQAAEQFSVFAKQTPYDLIVVLNANADTDIVPTTTTTTTHNQYFHQHDTNHRGRVELYSKNVVVRLAAALGKTTGNIFGGDLPENYRD